jgi:signal recognition particle receptor subunit beta
VFVVDSAALAAPAALADAADFLHDLLLALQRRHTRNSSSKGPAAIPVLVAANKQDVFTALPVGQVRARLEAEIGLVRVARSKRLADSGRGGMEGEGEDQEEDEEGWLGEFGSRDFSFAQMEESGVEVSVLGGNVKGEEGDDGARVQEWWDWIGRNM